MHWGNTALTYSLMKGIELTIKVERAVPAGFKHSEFRVMAMTWQHMVQEFVPKQIPQEFVAYVSLRDLQCGINRDSRPGPTY
jgi:hypothetical protein